MRRYWIPADRMTATDAIISGDNFHHIVDVCRVQSGDKFELLHGDGYAYLVEMGAIQKKQAIAKILEKRKIEPLRAPFVRLCVSVPKFQTFETILEKAVELGVAEVLPFISDFSFVRSPQAEPLKGKRARFLKIIQSATEQCGRGEIMPLAEPVRLEKLLESFNRTTNAAGLFPYEGSGDTDIKAALTGFHSPSDVWLFVGSEGGFSSGEVELFRANSMRPVTLGPQVLRVETACLALVSVIKYHFDLMR
ncbi:MAG: 16S rRNA (uracil(1498)-N(3))-methyltransferase [Bdellovibrionia bacterium]